MKNHIFISLILFIICHQAMAFCNTVAPDSAEIYLKKYQYQKTLAYIDKQLATNEPTKDAYILQGQAHKGLYNFGNAIQSYNKALALDTTDNTLIIEIANTYKQIPDYVNALKYYSLAAEKDSTNLLMSIEQANCLYALDLYYPAAGKYSAIHEQYPDNYFVTKRLALCYSKLSADSSAIYHFKKALELNANDMSSVISICNILIGNKNYEEGIRFSEQYMPNDSAHARVRSMNAYLYLLNKNYETSIDKFSKCVAYGDTSRFVIKNMGVAYFKISDYDSACYYLEKAYLADTTEINTLHYLGIACSLSNFHKEKGITYLEKAIKLYGPEIEEYTNLYRNLVEACRSSKSCPCEKTLSTSLRAYELNPGDNSLLYIIANIYDFCLKDKQNALIYYQKYLTTRKSKTDIREYYNKSFNVVEDRIKKLQSQK